MFKKLSKLPLITSFSSIFLITLVISAVLVISFFFVKTVIQKPQEELKHEYLVAKNFSVSQRWLKGIENIRDYKVLVEENYTPIVFASSLNNPTQIETIGDSKGLERYIVVVESKFGNLIILEDTDGDGSADIKEIYDTNLNNPWGVFYYNKNLYVAQKTSVIVYKNFVQNYLSKKVYEKETVITNLPALSTDDYKSILVKDNILYVSISASCEGCVESDLRRASIVAYNLDTKSEEIFAKDLKSVSDFVSDKNIFYAIDGATIKIVKKDNSELFIGTDNFLNTTSLEISDDNLFVVARDFARIIKYPLNSNVPVYRDFVVFDLVSKPKLFDIVDIKKYQGGFLVSDNQGVIYYLKSSTR